MSATLKRRLPLIAYLVLAAAMAYAVWAVKHEAAERRGALADSARMVTEEACARDNATRASLVVILRESERLQRQRAMEQNLSPRVIAESTAFYEASYERLTPVDCAAAAEQISDRR